MQKNDIIELKIDAIGSEGEGIAHVDGYALFVKDTVVGDRILARLTKLGKNYGYAKCEEILEESPDRIISECEVSKRCGGCQFQHLSYEAELRFKQDKVFSCIRRIGGFREDEIPMLPIIGCENIKHYRNKAQFPVGVGKSGEIVTGFYANRSHDIVDTRDCLIQVEENRDILNCVVDFMKEHHISAYEEMKKEEREGSLKNVRRRQDKKKPKEMARRGLVRHIMTRKGFATGEIGVCLVINGDTIPKKELFVKKLTSAVPGITSICINKNKKDTNVILGEEMECIFGKEYILDKIGEISFKISPFSFFQVNPEQTKKLYDTALAYAGLTGNEVVWDLYCGIGTISLFLAKKAREVHGIEIVPAAIENAKENAKINGISNAFFAVGKAEEEAEKLPKPDVIVVDPPRKGCDEKLLATIMKHMPERVVYVSCDPATLARDLKILCGEGGYKLSKVQPVDQFPRSLHTEVVAQLLKEASAVH